MRSEAPQWDSTVDDAALDDYGLPADDQPIPDYQPPRRKEGERPDYSSWVGDYGPVNAKGEKPMPPADGEEAARDLAAPADVDAALQAAAAAPAETAEEADDDALDEAFLQELAGDGADRCRPARRGSSTTEPAVPHAAPDVRDPGCVTGTILTCTAPPPKSRSNIGSPTYSGTSIHMPSARRRTIIACITACRHKRSASSRLAGTPRPRR